MEVSQYFYTIWLAHAKQLPLPLLMSLAHASSYCSSKISRPLSLAKKLWLN